MLENNNNSYEEDNSKKSMINKLQENSQIKSGTESYIKPELDKTPYRIKFISRSAKDSKKFDSKNNSFNIIKLNEKKNLSHKQIKQHQILNLNNKKPNQKKGQNQNENENDIDKRSIISFIS